MIAACFTPTDPVLCISIVQGKFAEKHIPLRLRNMIQGERYGGMIDNEINTQHVIL